LIEAVKVALVKDAEFFGWIEAHLAALATLEVGVIEACVERSALLHADDCIEQLRQRAADTAALPRRSIHPNHEHEQPQDPRRTPATH
jgi:hypothetical protein